MGSNYEKNGGRKSRDTLPFFKDVIVVLCMYCLLFRPRESEGWIQAGHQAGIHRKGLYPLIYCMYQILY